MKKYFSILLSVVIFGYFLPGFFNFAQAACNYSVTLDVKPKNATNKESLTFTATVKILSGTSGECAKNVSFTYKIKTTSGWQTINGYFNDPTMKAGVYQNTQAVHNAILRLNVLYSSLNGAGGSEGININVPNLNNLEFAVEAFNDVFSGDRIGSAGVSVGVSGSSGNNNLRGEKNIEVIFDKFSYKKADKIEIKFEPQNISSTDPEVNVYTVVNGKEISGGSYKLNIGSLSALTNKVKVQQAEVTEVNGFKNGENTVQIVMKVSNNQAIIFARGEGKVSASELSDTSPPRGGGGGLASGKKYACKDGKGIYVCGIKPDLSDSDLPKYAEGGECDFVQNPYPQVSATWCGKTDEQIKASGGGGSGGGDGNNTTPLKTIDCAKEKDSPDCIYNPLPTDDLISTFLLIIKMILGGVGVWAVMFIVVGGFRMVVSAGNEEAITQAKKTITWAVLGAAAALLSFSIISIVQNILHTAVK